MISIRHAENESRNRDAKRNRFILAIGERSWHISFEEALNLRNWLNKNVKTLDSASSLFCPCCGDKTLQYTGFNLSGGNLYTCNSCGSKNTLDK